MIIPMKTWEEFENHLLLLPRIIKNIELMKKSSVLWVVLMGWLMAFQSCDDSKTYAEMKEDEREAIRRYIELNDIKVITEKEFQEQDSTTDLTRNEYVLFEESGVYMQVLDRGNGELLEDGRHEVLARFWEMMINEEGELDTIATNNYNDFPDEFKLTKDGNSYSASFSTEGGGEMYSNHGSAYVPSGWLLPFNYLKVGREISARSKFKLIVPHSEGTSTASQQVIPCFYELTYQMSR